MVVVLPQTVCTNSKGLDTVYANLPFLKKNKTKNRPSAPTVLIPLISKIVIINLQFDWLANFSKLLSSSQFSTDFLLTVKLDSWSILEIPKNQIWASHSHAIFLTASFFVLTPVYTFLHPHSAYYTVFQKELVINGPVTCWNSEVIQSCKLF